jgi:hypothetical protein
MEALRAAGEIEARRFSCSSSGVIAPLVLIADEPARFIDDLLRALSGKRFMNRARVWKVADIDYLVNEVLAPNVNLDALTAPSSTRPTPPCTIAD